MAPIISSQAAPRLPDFVKPAMIQAKPAEPITESYDVTPVMSWEDASVQVEANLPMKEPLQPSTWSSEEKEEQSYLSSHIVESEEDYYPDFNREYPIFSLGELAEMFLKPRKRNDTPVPEPSTEELQPDYESLARLFGDKSDAVPEFKVRNTDRIVSVPEFRFEKPQKVAPVPESKVEKSPKVVSVPEFKIEEPKKVAPVPRPKIAKPQKSAQVPGTKVEKPLKVAQVPEFKVDKPHDPNVKGRLHKGSLTSNPANTKVQWSLLKPAAVGTAKRSVEISSCLISTKSIGHTRQDSSPREILTRNPDERKIKWNLLKFKVGCPTELQDTSKSQCTGLPMKSLASLQPIKPVAPTKDSSSLARKVQWSGIFNTPSANMMLSSQAPRNDIEKPLKETKKTHHLVGSDLPHVYENKIKRSQHSLKEPADCSTSADSHNYIKQRARLLADLDLKKQRLKNAFDQQLKSKERKSSIHFFKVDNGPKADKAIKATVRTVPAKYNPSIKRDTFLMSCDNQKSRKRPASSSDDSDCSVPAAKRARHRPRIVLKLFRKGSEWQSRLLTDAEIFRQILQKRT